MVYTFMWHYRFCEVSRLFLIAVLPEGLDNLPMLRMQRCRPAMQAEHDHDDCLMCFL